MRILVIGKYPPIEGGVASRTYWLAQALAKRGIEVTVLTNALCVEESYRERMDLSDPDILAHYEGPNLKVHSLSEPPPSHIPFSEAYVSRLVNKGLQIVAEEKPDLIYTHYLEPYGTASLFLKHLTGIPYVVQHAGSDIYRLLQSPDLSQILGKVLTQADGIFLSRGLHALADTLGLRAGNVYPMAPIGVSPEFSPEGKNFSFTTYGVLEPPEGVPLVAYIGKIGKNKSLISLCRALQNISQDFRFLLVSHVEQGGVFAKFLSRNPAFAEKMICTGFLPPWGIPNILRSSAMLVHLENKFPIPIHSPIQPFEAIATRTPLLLSNEIYQKIKSALPATNHLLNVVKDPDDTATLASKIQQMLQSKEEIQINAAAIRKEFSNFSSWDAHVDHYLTVFEKVMRKQRGFFGLLR